jgi:hypothetical protein
MTEEEPFQEEAQGKSGFSFSEKMRKASYHRTT